MDLCNSSSLKVGIEEENVSCYETENDQGLPTSGSNEVHKVHSNEHAKLKSDSGVSKDLSNKKETLENSSCNKRWHCLKCDYKCTFKSQLRKHSNQEHPTVKRHRCYICCSTFSNSTGLKKHIVRHDKDKNFRCKICSCKYSSLGMLNKHFRIHTGEKLIKCQMCNGKFINEYTFQFHMNVHTGEKPLSCDICDYKCARKSHLNSHMKTHYTERRVTKKTCI